MSSDDRDFDGYNVLKNKLGFTNHPVVRKELLQLCATKNEHVVATVKNMVDVQAPVNPGLNAPVEVQAAFKDEKYAYREIVKMRTSVLSTLYKSLEPDIKAALDDDPRATECLERGLLGEVWLFLTELVRGQGGNNILATLGDIQAFQMHDYSVWRTDMTL